MRAHVHETTPNTISEASVRGVLLMGWADLSDALLGPEQTARIGRENPDIPGSPSPSGWYPAGFQLTVAAQVLEQGCAGDEDAAVKALIDYTIGTIDPRLMKAAKWLGPRRVFSLAPKLFPHVYDVGACQSEQSRKVATLRWTGAALFGDTTWRLLQRAALLGVVRACGRNGTTRGGVGGEDWYELTVSWG